jgi:hypothetical protein
MAWMGGRELKKPPNYFFTSSLRSFPVTFLGFLGIHPRKGKTANAETTATE